MTLESACLNYSIGHNSPTQPTLAETDPKDHRTGRDFPQKVLLNIPNLTLMSDFALKA
jgi:hypothetical protein